MTLMERRRALMGVPSGRIPKEFQEVEWIEANLGPVILTTGSLTPQTTIKCSMMRPSYTPDAPDGYPAMFGMISPDVYLTTGRGTNNCYIKFGKASEKNSTTELRNTFHEIEIGPTSAKIDGTVKATYASATFTPSSNHIAIFARTNASGGYERKGYWRCKYFKIYNSDTLAFDGVPCYRKADGVIGMYDMVSNQFLTNAGTGTFTKGANV